MYGIDIEDDDLLARRSWRWLQVRITGLLDAPPVTLVGPGGVMEIHSTRLGRALFPPPIHNRGGGEQ